MSAREDGGPAFGSGAPGYEIKRGMSLRDWFAGQALTGLCASQEDGGTYHEANAQMAYALADAMLAERKK